MMEGGGFFFDFDHAQAALKRLSEDPHPNIILLHATFQDYATLYFLLELCPGGEMWSRTLNADGSKAGIPAPYSLARCWVAELVDAVEHCHAHNLVHRDLKPENLMLDARGPVSAISRRSDRVGPRRVTRVSTAGAATSSSLTSGRRRTSRIRR